MSTYRTSKIGNSFYFEKIVNGNSVPLIFRGVSLCGFEYLPSSTKDKTNILLSFFDPRDTRTQTLSNFKTILGNMLNHLKNDWKTNVIRVPICVSAYADSVSVFFRGDKKSYSYPFLINLVLNEITQRDMVAVVDGHIWGVDSSNKFKYRSIRTYNPAKDASPNNTQNYASQSYALQELMTDTNSGSPLSSFLEAWETIVKQTSSLSSGIWYEPVNEPFFHSSLAKNSVERYNLWRNFYNQVVLKIRSLTDNIIIVNGLNRGYDFSVAISSLVNSDGPFQNNKNIAYGIHPFQLASCCGLITRVSSSSDITGIRKENPIYKSVSLTSDKQGYTIDQSMDDPHERLYCNYNGAKPLSFKNKNRSKFFNLPFLTNNTRLTKYTCSDSYSSTDSTKLPPCNWNSSYLNPNDYKNVVGSYVGDCPTDVKTALSQKSASVPLSGWDKYFLGMRRYGPLIATAFGTFDCSLPYLMAFLDYAKSNNISWIAFGIQPYLANYIYTSKLNPCSLLCLTVPAITSLSTIHARVSPVLNKKYVVGNYFECLVSSNCPRVLTPIGNKDAQYGAIIKREMLIRNVFTEAPQTTTSAPSPTTDEESEYEILTTPEPDTILTSSEAPEEETTTTSSETPEEEIITSSSEAPEEETTTTSSETPKETTTTSSEAPEEETTTTSSETPKETTTTSSEAPEEETTTTSTETPEEKKNDYNVVPVVIILFIATSIFLATIFASRQGLYTGLDYVKRPFETILDLFFTPIL